MTFSVLESAIEETARENEMPEDLVIRLALEKAAAGLYTIRREERPSYPVLAADTVVVIDDSVLGKPSDAAHAFDMLERLSGRTHRVLTAVAVHDDRVPGQRLSESFVTMKRLERWEMERYWATGEPRDKAGGYAVQGIGGGFVERLEGSYSGVVGLPMFETRELLAAAGVDWL
ncbi:MAG: Maf family protein [Gammaproteobacteria bacterium]|nr:Maf family protein [Gammaproteobacteria bacterium]